MIKTTFTFKTVKYSAIYCKKSGRCEIFLKEPMGNNGSISSRVGELDYDTFEIRLFTRSENPSTYYVTTLAENFNTLKESKAFLKANAEEINNKYDLINPSIFNG